MVRVLFVSSEKSNKFGINRVLISLKRYMQKNISIDYSNNILSIFQSSPDLIHIHGCWKVKLLIFFLISKIISIKVVISPHGMIDPISLSQKKIKKKLGWYFYQKFIFIYSDLIIVNSLLEKKNLQSKLKVKKKIIIIPHGIEINKNFNLKGKLSRKKLSFVYFSRIHPSKNLEHLVNIWSKNEYLNNLELSIYGAITDKEYFNKIKQRIFNKPNIKYKGSIYQNLQKKLSNYDIFIFPSNSENFGLVVLEAMNSGLYSLLNKKLPWKILERMGYGNLTKFDSQSLEQIIKKIDKIKIKIRKKKFKEQLYNFLKKNHDLKKISNKYIQNYEKIFN